MIADTLLVMALSVLQRPIEVLIVLIYEGSGHKGERLLKGRWVKQFKPTGNFQDKQRMDENTLS